MARRVTFSVLLLVATAATLPVAAPAAVRPIAWSTASRAACPGQGDAGAASAAQEKTMLCLVNRARSSHGLASLDAVTPLTRAAAHKSSDIIRCDEFSHEACGREFTYWMDRFGYHGCQEGENIAWGSGSYATPRQIFSLWMRSAGHRRNILGPYEDTGIGLQVGTLEGNAGAHVWTQEFGGSC